MLSRRQSSQTVHLLRSHLVWCRPKENGSTAQVSLRDVFSVEVIFHLIIPIKAMTISCTASPSRRANKRMSLTRMLRRWSVWSIIHCKTCWPPLLSMDPSNSGNLEASYLLTFSSTRRERKMFLKNTVIRGTWRKIRNAKKMEIDEEEKKRSEYTTI